MKTASQLYFLHALTPLHVGEDVAMGAVDLPTMRERHTGYPLVPGSSIKGVLREQAEERFRTQARRPAEKVVAAFGPPSQAASDHRGGLVFTDGHLLALPVRSLCGTFAWVTCARVLQRLNRDLESAGWERRDRLPVRRVDDPGRAWIPQPAKSEASGAVQESALLVPGGNQEVFLEEMLLTANGSPEISRLAERLAEWLWPGDREAAELFRCRLLVVHDDVFGFYTRLGLEVRARVKIDSDRGTVAEGPWVEEHLPAESLLAGLAMGRPTQVKPRAIRPQNGADEPALPAEAKSWSSADSLRVLQEVAGGGPVLRFGGLASIGLGRTRFRLVARSGQEGRR